MSIADTIHDVMGVFFPLAWFNCEQGQQAQHAQRTEVDYGVPDSGGPVALDGDRKSIVTRLFSFIPQMPDKYAFSPIR